MSVYRDKAENNGFPDAPKPPPPQPQPDPLANLRWQLATLALSLKPYSHFSYDEAFDVAISITDPRCCVLYKFDHLRDKMFERLDEIMEQEETRKLANAPEPRNIAYSKYRKGLRFKW